MDPILDMDGGSVAAGEGVVTEDNSADNTPDLSTTPDQNTDFDLGELEEGGVEQPTTTPAKHEASIKVKPPVKKDQETNDNTKDKQPNDDAEDEEDNDEDDKKKPGEDEEEEDDSQELDANKTKVEGEDKKPKGRDIDWLPKPVSKALKSLDNKTFNKVGPVVKQLFQEAATIVKQNAEYKAQLDGKGIPQNWYEHPAAYQLSAEYGDITRQLNMADRESRFYEQQVVKIKSGEEWHYIKGYTEDGTPIMSEPQKPSNDAEVRLMNGINELNHTRAQRRSEIAELQKGFKNRYEQSATAIKTEVDKYVSSMEEGLRPAKEDVEFMMKTLGPSLQNNPLAYGYGQMWGVMTKLAAEVVRLRTVASNKAKLANDQRQAGPSSDKAPKNGAVNSDKGTIKLKSGKVVPKVFDLEELTAGE